MSQMERERRLLAMWVRCEMGLDQLTGQLDALNCDRYRCYSSVADDDIVDVLIEAPTESDARSVRDAFAVRVDEVTGLEVVRSWILRLGR
jgi:hypothetical protein